MLNNISNTVFLESESISLLPMVSGEWNHNLFNPPHLTVAGDGTLISSTLTNGTVTSVTSGGKPNFTTKSFEMSNGNGSVTYTASNLDGDAYKIVTYIKTDNPKPILINTSAKGTKFQHGSSQEEASELGWTKVTTYAGSTGTSFSSLTFTINASSLSGTETNATVMFTLPEIYKTTYFDYQNNSLWPTESPFTNFRPGESYVTSGNILCTTPSSYRKINNHDASGDGPFYSPVTSITQNPETVLNSGVVPLFKNAMASSISSFKYFVSDPIYPIISAVYEKDIHVNKLVIKLNTIVTTPTINLFINGTAVSVDGSTSIEMPTNSDGACTGLITLYWTGSSWTKTQWSAMPVFGNSGQLIFDSLPVSSAYTSIRKITVSQVNAEKNDAFASGYDTSSHFDNDLLRMHVVEISPRLEIDLSNFTESFSVDKTLDSKSGNLPISSINSNTATVNISGIPVTSGDSIIPIFSSEGNNYPTVLSGMLRRGIKLYLGYKVVDYSILSSGNSSGLSNYIPAGIFYSDNWDETDIKSIALHGYDIVRYLQLVPAADYVVNKKTAFETISDIMDLSGFTDYDHDSLYDVCNDDAMPFDLYYYSVYSKDTTLIGAINELIMPYQIAAYMDEYGIMKFKSLRSILTSKSSTMTISDENIMEGGYSIINKIKPGKISIKYTQPKTKQSLSLKNVQSTSISESPSFVYVTSNDILWEQQKSDVLGFNYIDQGIDESSTTLNINAYDQENIFYTYSRDASGYSIVENEVMSFDYKEYKLSTTKIINAGTPEEETVNVDEFVSIKNDLELQSAINKFIKRNQVSIRTGLSSITNVVGNGGIVTYTANNSFKENDYVSIGGISPEQYNMTGYIYSRTATSFTMRSAAVGTYVSGGEATINGGYDITITSTGNITNIKRGLFGTSPSEHKRITDLDSKGLTAFKWDYDQYVDAENKTSIINDHEVDNVLPSVDKIKCFGLDGTDLCISPANHLDPGYQTYSVKFEFPNLPSSQSTAAGLFFNNDENYSGYINVWLLRLNKINSKTGMPAYPFDYEYILKIDDGSGTLAWANVTGECKKIIENGLITASKTIENGIPKYYSQVQFNLQAVTYVSDGSDGEDGTVEDPLNIIKIFINGIGISGWQIPGTPYNASTNPNGTGWKTLGTNKETGLKKNPSLPLFSTYGKTFGFRTTDTPSNISGLHPQLNILESTNTHSATLLEIHATTKPLLSRSVSYYYQDIEFLDGMIEDRPMALEHQTYLMQTTPEVRGINIYDVEYGTPSAITALHSNIQYMWRYVPGNDLPGEESFAKTLVDEYSVAYSTLRNSGHRGKIAMANNSSHTVFVKRNATSVSNAAVNFTMWTNESIVPSDPELIEKVLDIGNSSEVVQMDTKWLQSQDAAYKVMKIIEYGLTGFSKDISLDIFGNPLIQIGDVITLTYNLKGINQVKCVVVAVSNSFATGLATRLTLNRLEE